MAIESDGSARRIVCRYDPGRYPGERRRLAFRAIPVSEHTAVDLETPALQKGQLGNVAAVCLCSLRSGLDRTGRRGSLALAFLDSPEQLGLHGSRGTFLRHVRGHGGQDLEQHTDRDESRTEPATLAQIPDGRIDQPDQSPFSF